MYGHRRNYSQPQPLPSPTKSTLTTTDQDHDPRDPYSASRFQNPETPFSRDFEDVGLVGSPARGYGHDERGQGRRGEEEEEEDESFRRYREEGGHVGFAIGGESDEEDDQLGKGGRGNGDGKGDSGLAPPLEPFDYPRQLSRDPTPRSSPLYPPYPSPPRATASSRSQSNTSVSLSRHALPPYLTLLPRLSLILLTSLPLLSLLLIILPSLLSASTSFTDSLSDMQESINAKCLGVEAGVRPWLDGEGEAGLWRILREREEAAVRAGVVRSLHGLESVLNDSLTIMEQVINFIIDTYRSLLLCTIEFAVQGTLALLIAAVQLISTSVTNSLDSIRTSIQSDIASANSLIQTAVTSINSVTSVVHVTLAVPQFVVPSLSLLENVTFPTTIQDDLIKLNNSIPDLNELKAMVETLVDMPFEELRSRINISFASLIADVNTTSLTNTSTSLARLATVSANATTVSTTSGLCSNIDTSFLSSASSAISRMTHITAGLLVLAFLLLLWGLMAWEWYKYKCMVDHAAEVETTLERDVVEGRKVDGMTLVNVVEHPVLERYLGGVLDRVTRDERKTNNIRWFLSYITHITALALLTFGLLSLITVQLQIGAITALRKDTISDSSSAIVSQATNFAAELNTAAFGQSQAYANDMNALIQNWQTMINEDLLGSWLNTTTVVLNSTLVGFYSEVESLLNDTFGGTILAAPINTFVYCILGSKISNVETALTWINRHSQLTLPVILEDALMLPASTMQALVTPVVAAATGDSTSGDESDGVIGRLFDRYLSSLKRQRTMAGLFIALYGIIVLIGLIVLLWSTFLEEKVMRWRMERLRKGQSPAPSNELAQSGRGKTWSYTPSVQEKEKTQLFATGTERSPSRDSGFNNEKPESSPPKTDAGHKPLFLGGFATSPPRKKPVPKISYPVMQDSRPAMGKHLSSWSTKVAGAAKNMLHPQSSGHGGGTGLGRNISQRSEQSWTGIEPSPWVDRRHQRSTPTDEDAVSRASIPSNVVPASNNPREWSLVYPRDDRYPSTEFKPDPLATRTPIADSYKWTDSAVRRLSPLAGFASDKQHHRDESFSRK